MLLVIVALAAGAGLAVQATANAALRTHVGRPEWAATISYGVGLATLFAWMLIARLPWPSGTKLVGAPWWTYTGGVFGAAYVTILVILTPRIGVGATLAFGIAGQLACALVLDHAGALGLPVHQVTLGRAIGAVLLAVGAALIRG